MHIIRPYKEILVPASACIGLKGFYRYQTINKFSGKMRIDTGWIPNILLTTGLNQLHDQASWLDWVHIGVDGTPPTAGNSQLGARVAYTNNSISDVTGTQGSAPYYGYRRKKWRFNVGDGQGGQNISEAGVGWGSALDNLVSRAQVIDPITQVPTTVTPLADEILDVTYEMRYYPPLTPVVQNSAVTLDGTAYDVTTSAVNVTGGRLSTDIGKSIGQYSLNASDWAAHDGTSGAITDAGPNGNSAACDNANQYNLSYQGNSYEITMGCNTGSAGWNLASGIRTIRWRTTAGDYQSEFSSNPGGLTIPKDNTYTMVLQFTLAWSQYV